jgi:hypothetical protein
VLWFNSATRAVVKFCCEIKTEDSIETIEPTEDDAAEEGYEEIKAIDEFIMILPF